MKEKAALSLAGNERLVVNIEDKNNNTTTGCFANHITSPRPHHLSAVPAGWMAYEAALFVQALHGDLGGFVRFATKSTRFYDHHTLVADAARTARDYAGGRDVYVSLGAYHRPRKSLAGIRALHVDLDFYTVPSWKGAEPGDVLAAALEVLTKANVPPPSLAVATGRGLQIVWLVSPVKSQAHRKATAAMRGLIKHLAAFGADPACTDLARMFRLPGTVNSKNGCLARLLSCDPHRQDFDALCRVILGPCPARRDWRPPKTARSMRAENRSLAHRRLADLGQIVFGKWGGKTPEGFRNVIAHLAAVHLVQLSGDAFESTRQWCTKWTDGHDENEISRTVKTVLRKKAESGGYRYSGRRIGELLGITSDEVHRFQLTTVYAATDTPQEIKRRQRDRDVETKRQKRRVDGAKPQDKSARRLKPWAEMGISRATYYRQRKQNISETISVCLHTVSSNARGTGAVAAEEHEGTLRRVGIVAGPRPRSGSL